MLVIYDYEVNNASVTVDEDTAPEFELPGVVDGQFEQFSLTDATEADNAVLMFFYPFDFSHICVAQACAMRDLEWFEFTPDLSVWAISGDSCYVHREFAEEYDLNFPLLADTAGRVAESYGALHEELEGHERVPKRAVVLVASDRTIQYKWVTDEALTQVDFKPVVEAVGALAQERDDVDPAEIEVEIDQGVM